MVGKSCPALRPCSNKKQKARPIGQESNDCLSKLPEEIIDTIISSLSLKDAARFSLVSRHCEFIWRCVPVLIFEDSQAVEKMTRWSVLSSWAATVEERPSFVRRVDCVLEKHLGATVDELRITSDLDADWQSHVDKWASFAVDKQVKRLEFNFSSRWLGFINKSGCTERPHYAGRLDLPPKFTDINSFLTSLCLRNVNVTDEFSDKLFHSCPLLENLCISDSKYLTRVSGSLEHLKHLEVSFCWSLKKIDISARMLHSLILYSHAIELHIKDASSLSEMSIGSPAHSHSVAYAFDSFSNYFSQLVYLSVMISILTESLKIHNPVVMPNLEHLEIQVHVHPNQSVRGCIPLIAASPNLQKLTLKLVVFFPEFERDWPVCEWVGFPLKCLKTLELVGYMGQPSDLELAFFVFENASMLEEVIVDFVPRFYPRHDDSDVRERLVMLQKKLPQSVKLTIK